MVIAVWVRVPSLAPRKNGYPERGIRSFFSARDGVPFLTSRIGSLPLKTADFVISLFMRCFDAGQDMLESGVNIPQ